MVLELRMPSADHILSVLDSFAEDFQFPGFNNMNYESVDSRLHVLRDGDRWAMVIEEVVDWVAADGIVTLLFAMGDVLEPNLSTLTPVEADAFWDDDEMVVPESVTVRGRSVAVDRPRVESDCEEHGLEVGFAILLQLVESNRDDLFATEQELRKRIGEGFASLLRLDEWAHPDVYGGPKPSESEAFQQLAEVLASGDASRYAPTEKANNRDWKMWMESR